MKTKKDGVDMDLFELTRKIWNNLDGLRRECKLRDHPEIKSVRFSDDGLEIVVRSKIETFDEGLADYMLADPLTDGKIKNVLRHLREIEQEHKFATNGESVWRAEHHPDGAFCDPFRDLGEFDWCFRDAMERGDCVSVVETMIAETASFVLGDNIKIERLADWFNRTEF